MIPGARDELILLELLPNPNARLGDRGPMCFDGESGGMMPPLPPKMREDVEESGDPPPSFFRALRLLRSASQVAVRRPVRGRPVLG